MSVSVRRMLGYVLVAALSTAGFAVVERFSPTYVVQAYGVVSQCGVYAVIAETNHGTVLLTAEAENVELAEQVIALPQENRITILVPCPGPIL